MGSQEILNNAYPDYDKEAKEATDHNYKVWRHSKESKLSTYILVPLSLKITKNWQVNIIFKWSIVPK